MNEEIDNIQIQSPEEVLNPALNFQNLRQLGLETVIQTGSDQWTDYNEHDPGITILESLIYVLTDLAYRTDFSITDIIAQQNLSPDQLAETQFYTARKILTSNPVTFNDLRKSIIDQKGIDNAWIQATEAPLNTQGGMVDILVDPSIYPSTDEAEEALRKQVEHTFAAHRMLGQDLGTIIIRKPAEILLNLDLVISPNAVAEKVVATILSELDTHISNTAHFLSLEEMLKKMDGDVNRVFDGPELLHGFLPDDALAPMQQEWRSVDLIPLILNIEDTVMVKSLRLRTMDQEQAAIIKNKGGKRDGTAQGKWFNQVSIQRTQRFRLAATQYHQFNIQKGETPCARDEYKLTFELKKINSQKRVAKLAPQERDLPIPTGNFRDIKKYISIQQEFPQIYGLDPIGPPPDASDTRLGQIKQLKTYLLIFDQLMANYLAQLSNLGQLFSWDKKITQTYFFQGLQYSVHNLGELLVGFPVSADHNDSNAKLILEEYKSKLAVFREDEATFLKRRNRFLNHLLARFGQDLNAYTESISKQTLEQQLKIGIETKLRVLNQYPALSKRRGVALNPFDLNPESSFSGMRSWVETVFDMVPESIDTVHYNSRFVQDSYDPAANNKQVFSQYVLATGDGSPIDMKELMRIGGDKENYEVNHIPNKGHHVILYKLTDPNKPAQVYQLTDVYQNPEKTLEVIDELAYLINRYNRTSERIYLVEHLLLRPTSVEAYFGLELLADNGSSWMSTTGWYPKHPLSQITTPPDPDTQFYYCIDTKTPCQKEVPDTQKSTPDNPVTKTVHAKYAFVIKPIDPSATFVKYKIELQFGVPGSMIQMHSTIPFESEDLAEKAIKNWITKLQKSFIPTSAKNKIKLWRPILKSWIPLRIKPGRYTNILKDPYSFILTVVIPKWPSRFQDKGFKKSLERIISNECPAHLWPNILWLGKVKFQEFQRLYQMWWNAYLEKESGAFVYRKALMEFIMKHSISKRIIEKYQAAPTITNGETAS